MIGKYLVILGNGTTLATADNYKDALLLESDYMKEFYEQDMSLTLLNIVQPNKDIWHYKIRDAQNFTFIVKTAIVPLNGLNKNPCLISDVLDGRFKLTNEDKLN